MGKNNDKITKEIIFFTKKLPLTKQEEALGYIKWLWLSTGKGKEKQTPKTSFG